MKVNLQPATSSASNLKSQPESRSAPGNPKRKKNAPAHSTWSSSESESDLEVVGVTLPKESNPKSTLRPQKKRLHTIIPSSTPQAQSHQPERTPSPSPDSALALAKVAYTSPDRLRLREALMSGGEIKSNLKVVEECETFVNYDC